MNQKELNGICHVKSVGGWHLDIEGEITGTDQKCKFIEDSEKKHRVKILNYRKHAVNGTIHASRSTPCIEFPDADGEKIEHSYKAPPQSGSKEEYPVEFKISQCDFGPDREGGIETYYNSDDDSDFTISPTINTRVRLNPNCISAD